MKTLEQLTREEMRLLRKFHWPELKKEWPHANITFHEGWPFVYLGSYLASGKELDTSFFYDRDLDTVVPYPPEAGRFAAHLQPQTKEDIRKAAHFEKLRLSPISLAMLKARNEVATPARLKKYGLSQEDYDKMFREQDGRCYICQRLPKKHLCIDHDHKKGFCREAVRGLLCPWCNYMLGFFRDNPEKFERAAQYLRRPNPFVISPSTP